MKRTKKISFHYNEEPSLAVGALNLHGEDEYYHSKKLNDLNYIFSRLYLKSTRTVELEYPTLIAVIIQLQTILDSSYVFFSIPRSNRRTLFSNKVDIFEGGVRVELNNYRLIFHSVSSIKKH